MRPQSRFNSKPRPLGFSLARLSSAAAISAALLAGVAGAQSASFFWDPGVDGDGNLGGAGAWDLLPTSTFWDPTGADPLAPIDNVVWPNSAADTAVFTGAGGAVSLGAGVIVGTMQFDVTNYVLSNNTLALDGAATVAVTNVGDIATINSALSGVAGLTKSGAGILVLTGNNASLTGNVAVNAGILSITADTQLGAGTNGISLDTGGVLRQAFNGQVTLGAGRVITVGAGGGAIEVTNAGPTGKLFLGTAGQLVGGSSSVLTKTGNGTLQLTSANTGFTGSLVVSAGQVEVQNGTALGSTPGQVTIGGTGEFVVTAPAVPSGWAGPIVASGGGGISSNTGNGTFTGGITANGQFSAFARDFNATGNARTLTLSGPIVGAGGMIAKGPSAGTGRVLLKGDASGWSGALQVDPNTQAVVSVGFGTGSTTSLPTGDLTLNGGRLTITPSIGTGLTTTSGVSGRWISTGNAGIQNTFA